MRCLGWLLVVFLVLSSPHYPWYFLVLVPFLALHPRRPPGSSRWACVLFYDASSNDVLPSYDTRITVFMLATLAALAHDLWRGASARDPLPCRRDPMTDRATAEPHGIDPRRYHEASSSTPWAVAARDPVCLYLETTNRCNLLCTTCPRTYADLEPPADMSWELFTRIVDQVPNIARVVLHGVGEPMLVKELPRMVRYLKDRGAYVLFNTNGTVLTAKKGRELADTGLDELRVSLDAADARDLPAWSAARTTSTASCATCAPSPRCRRARA